MFEKNYKKINTGISLTRTPNTRTKPKMAIVTTPLYVKNAMQRASRCQTTEQSVAFANPNNPAFLLAKEIRLYMRRGPEGVSRAVHEALEWVRRLLVDLKEQEAL